MPMAEACDAEGWAAKRLQRLRKAVVPREQRDAGWSVIVQWAGLRALLAHPLLRPSGIGAEIGGEFPSLHAGREGMSWTVASLCRWIRCSMAAIASSGW